jgi:hypothetical protein
MIMPLSDDSINRPIQLEFSVQDIEMLHSVLSKAWTQSLEEGYKCLYYENDRGEEQKAEDWEVLDILKYLSHKLIPGNHTLGPKHLEG